MTTLLLVRHALCDPVGTAIAGRAAGVPLNAAGEEQAARLGARLRALPIDAVYSSPLERARQTAAPIAAARRVAVEVLDGVGEIDFGEWTGRTFAELDGGAAWRRFNSFRSGTRIPGGELIVEVQARAVAALGALGERHPEGVVAVVSHGDVIKAALAYYLGMPLDLMRRLEIDPASASTLVLDVDGVRVLRMNDTGDPPI
jgi:probable phosphoglycerate mutase